MRFLNLDMLLFFILITILTGLLLFYANNRRKQYLNLFGFSGPRYRHVNVLFVLSIAFLSAALLRPQGNMQEKEIEQEGRDIVIAVDISYSMLAEDLRPSRLEVAKRKVVNFLRLATGDRVGLVTFSGAAFADVPLTIDHASILNALRQVDPQQSPLAGTNFIAATEVALSLLQNQPEREKAILFISDGEDFTGNYDQILGKLKEQRVSVFGLGVGTIEGGNIILDGQPAYDSDNNLIVTKLQEKFLSSLCKGTGGVYIRASKSSKDIQAVYTEIGKRVKKYENTETTLEIWSEYFQYPLALAMLLLLVKQIFSFKHGLSF